jgi:hypothetical protein
MVIVPIAIIILKESSGLNTVEHNAWICNGFIVRLSSILFNKCFGRETGA